MAEQCGRAACTIGCVRQEEDMRCGDIQMAKNSCTVMKQNLTIPKMPGAGSWKIKRERFGQSCHLPQPHKVSMSACQIPNTANPSNPTPTDQTVVTRVQ
jgi:hypothetical protein